MNNPYQKLCDLADDLDQRAAALQRLAGDLRQEARLLEAEIRNVAETSDRPDRGATGEATFRRHPDSEPTAVLKLVTRHR